MIVNIQGCTHASVKTADEIWLIDPAEVILYRKIKGNKEQIIPIKDNHSMNKFLCISQEEYAELVEAILEQRDGL